MPTLKEVTPLRDRTGSTNGLFRLNYFDGRFLTAESLRREQAYWDHRAQIDAQAFPLGIAWGLGLKLPAAIDPLVARLQIILHPPKGYSDTGGMDPDKPLTLEPGLAFSGIGKPIVVGRPFEFTFADLMDKTASNRTMVIDGGTQFAPCVCLAPAPPAKGSAGPALAAGPYLLLIQATEKTHGEAKIYGGVCSSTSQTTLCEADGYQGGFALSLASFPITVPLNTVSSAWDLRGLLSAYYFDVYEHALLQRWQAPYPQADPNDASAPDFCAGLGPFDRQDGPVPLAMVYDGQRRLHPLRRSLDPAAPAGVHRRGRVGGQPAGGAHAERLPGPAQPVPVHARREACVLEPFQRREGAGQRGATCTSAASGTSRRGGSCRCLPRRRRTMGTSPPRRWGSTPSTWSSPSAPRTRTSEGRT